MSRRNPDYVPVRHRRPDPLPTHDLAGVPIAKISTKDLLDRLGSFCSRYERDLWLSDDSRKFWQAYCIELMRRGTLV